MPEYPSTIEVNIYRRIAWRLVPFLLVCYIIAMVDRLNVGYAKLQFLVDLHFDEATFGMAAGALYVGYILFEVPSNLMLDRVGVRATLLRIMLLWGVFAMAMAFAADRWSFYGLRFLIGAAEAGFFPGIVFYLTLWFPNAWRARITSLFALAVPLSGVLAAPASSWIMIHMARVAGFHGWQWLFLIEGAPALVLAIAAYLYLPNRPADAKFLTADEKAVLSLALGEEDRKSSAKGGSFTAFKDLRVYGLALVYFAFYSTQSILLLWVPTLLKNTGLKDLTEIGWRASAIFVVGAIGMAAIGYSSDRLQERRWHLVGCGVAASAALGSLAYFAHDTNATMVALMCASAGIFAYLALFWTLPTAVLGPKSRAGGIALVSSIGASGSALSPTFIGWMQVWTGSLYGAISCLALLFLASLAVLWICAPKPARTLKTYARPFAQAAEG